MMDDFPENVKKGSFDSSQCNSTSDSPWAKFVHQNEKGPFNEVRVAKVDVPEYHDNTKPAQKIELLVKKKSL